MRVTNGWTFDRDARGIWLVAGTIRIGPYPTTSQARAEAYRIPAPKPKPKKKPDAPTERLDA